MRNKFTGADLMNRLGVTKSLTMDVSLSDASRRADDREIDARLYTGVSVLRYSWDGEYDLAFDLSPDRLDLSRANNNAPVLLGHDRSSLAKVGVIKAGTARVEHDDSLGRDVVKATLAFMPDELLVDDITRTMVRRVLEGWDRQLSIGATIHEAERIKAKDRDDGVTTRDLYIGTKWEIDELSVVTIPADADANTGRAALDKDIAGTAPLTNTGAADSAKFETEKTMKKLRELAAAAKTKFPHLAAAIDEALGAALMAETEPTPEAFQAAIDALVSQPKPERKKLSAAKAVQLSTSYRAELDEALDVAVKLAPDAAADLRPAHQSAVTLFGKIDEDDEDAFVNRHHMVTANFRKELQNKLAAAADGKGISTGAPATSLISGVSGQDAWLAGAGNHMQHLMSGGSVALNDNGRRFRGMTDLDIAREFLRIAGVATSSMSRMEIARMALRVGNSDLAMTTSDLPNVFTTSINASLLALMEKAVDTFSQWTRRQDMPDFNEQSLIKIGGMGALQEVKENGKYELLSLGDGKETMRVAKLGGKVGITMEMVVNNRIGSVIPAILQGLRNETVNAKQAAVYSLLYGTTTMGDGYDLFDSSHHANLATAHLEAPSVAALSDARKAFALQTGINSKKLRLKPRYIILPEALVDGFDQLVQRQFAPTSAANAVPEWIHTLIAIGEPLLDDSDKGDGKVWYLAADPANIDTILWGGIAGEPMEYVTSWYDEEHDVRYYKLRVLFGAGVANHQALFANPGASS